MKSVGISAWLDRHWVAAALCMGIGLLLLVPLLRQSWGLPLLLIYLQIPVYMLHQVEEHTGDRFRRFVNERGFGGAEVLTPEAVLWINIPGVWGVTLAALYAAVFFGPGWGLSAVYLVLVNGVIHVVAAAGLRCYNPGLWTGLALFLPGAGVALWCVASTAGVSAVHHAVGLATALAIHAAIIIYTGVRATRVQRGALPSS